jgi:predicted amidohydrolase
LRDKPTVIAIAQVNPRLGDLDFNLSMHLDRIAQARDLGAEIIVFPELSLTGYLLKDLTADASQNLEKSALVQNLASESRDIAVLAGLVEEADDFIYYNSAVLFEGGSISHVHRKVYLPTYGMFDEERYFSPGSMIRSFDSFFGCGAILICEDYWHPSSVYLAAQDGAVVHFYLSNAPLRGMTLPDEITSTDIAEGMARVSSQLYGVYTVFSNRTGYEDGICFAGGSCVISPTGSVIARADREKEELLLAELDPDQVRRARTFFPLMGDEKLDMVHRELTRIREKRFNIDDEE